ncbi:MAG: acyl-CoA carboxylase subunit beta [Gordonia sp. (in: high G+C Gram-positive bacteria)]|uniref:acyl-CoA carboxylase subunit beta n=1 Tax=Gordonia sp. (in: high G+C Gram-positive bacteria) TaxID=84139 RepID=UPI0039E4EA22
MTTASEDSSAIDIHTTAGKLADLRNRLAETRQPLGEAAIEKVHAANKLTARERIEQLLDEGSFVEIDALVKHRTNNFGLGANKPLGDGVVTGYGTVDGREICVYSQDATVFDGSLGEMYGEKIIKVLDLALKSGRPVVAIVDGAGARLEEGVVALAKYGEIFQRNIRASGVVPQIAVVLGAAVGEHVHTPALSDFVVMVDDASEMYLIDPEVIKTVTGETVSPAELGGAAAQMTTAGNAHYVAADEKEALDYVKDLLSFLPSNNRAEPPRTTSTLGAGPIADHLTDADRELDSLIPDSPSQPYDSREIITRVVDDGDFLEVQPGRAKNIVIGFARIDGISVGVVANQPDELAGCLDIDASEKAARFVRTCDAFSVPIVTFVDVPGFLPGTDQEHSGIVRRGAKLLYAYGEATVGKVTVITRKAYGSAYDVMGSKHLGADVNLAWPTAQIAVMGAPGAVEFLHRDKIAEAKDKGENLDELMASLQAEYEDAYITPYVAAERGYVDAVIPPSHTRGQIATALRLLGRKVVVTPPRKHGNIPL